MKNAAAFNDYLNPRKVCKTKALRALFRGFGLDVFGVQVVMVGSGTVQGVLSSMHQTFRILVAAHFFFTGICYWVLRMCESDASSPQNVVLNLCIYVSQGSGYFNADQQVQKTHLSCILGPIASSK